MFATSWEISALVPRLATHLTRALRSFCILYAFGFAVSVMLDQPRSQPQKYAERHWIRAVGLIERRRLAVKRYVGSQAKLPGVILKQVTHPPERVAADAIRRMNRRFREQLILVDEFEARVGVVAALEIHG